MKWPPSTASGPGMSFFKKLFSTSYREALALEGAGRYAEAAQAYNMCGERAAVARMHRLAARGLADPFAKVEALRVAADFAEGLTGTEAPALARDVHADLAAALVALVDATELMDRSDRGLLEEAADLYTELGQHGAAGEVLARLGHVNRAAEAFESAGDIARMEEMFRSADRQQEPAAAYQRAVDALAFAESAGDHVGVLEALEQCLALRPQDAELSARLQNLRDRMPTCARVSLTSPGGLPWHLVGGSRVGIGREDDNEILLVDAGISRRHARMARQAQAILLEDLGSTHGTWFGGVRLQEAQTLPPSAEFRLSDSVQCTVVSIDGEAPCAAITVRSGHLKGQHFCWSNHILTGTPDVPQPPWVPPSVAFAFLRGYWHVIPSECAGEVTVGGAVVTNPTLLRLRAELTVGGVQVTVG